MNLLKTSPFLFLILVACGESNQTLDVAAETEVKESMSFTTLTTEETGIDFTNSITETDTFNYYQFEYIYNGGGVAVGDVNNDGLADIYFTGNQVSDKLYLNKGDMQFEDVTEKAIGRTASEGWHTGVTMADVNQDGWLDIYVSRSGKSIEHNLTSNLLYINQGEGVFKEMAAEYGVDVVGRTTQSVFFDYDNDDDLDLFVVNYPYNEHNIGVQEYSMKTIKDNIKECGDFSDRLLRNDSGVFKDVTMDAGVCSFAFGLGVSVSDLNNDGYQDIYVSNDYNLSDFIYINDKNGGFQDESLMALNHMSNFSMGNEIADINNDGWLDIFVADMASEDHIRSKKNMSGMSTEKFMNVVNLGFNYQYMFNSLQLNNGNGTFSEIAQMAGVSKTDWSWAPLFVDFDNDGLKDLFITNGYKRDTRDNDFNRKNLDSLSFDSKLSLMPSTKLLNYIYKNTGKLHFDKKMENWNLNTPINSNGAAYADFDNDGDVDLVVNNMDAESSILRNDLISESNYLRIKLKKGNISYLGSKVKIKSYNDQIFYQELQTTRGFQSSVEDVLHFGLGDIESISELEITWADGSKTIKTNLETNKVYVFDFNTEEKVELFSEVSSNMMFEKTDIVDFKHKEQFVNDFEREVLLPNKMSQLGPFMSKGDVDGDGLEDFYVSGSKGFSGQLFIQNKNGNFEPKSGPWQNQKQREEMDSKFFDVDNDGDLDLYVVSGGNEYTIRSKNLYDQLYINDGKGNFVNESNRLPFMETSGQRIDVADYDNDGDLDVFVGGRQTPGFYPMPPRSYLLKNENGQFVDVTIESKDLMGPGLITESIFDDFDQDGDVDLICVGEWMAPSFFENNNGIFTNVTTKYGLQNEVGWWMSITKGDFNGDGKNDYILGNIGKNNKFHPSKEKPLEIYCADFDKSGTYDIVLGKYQNNVCYPVRGKQCSTEQMPFVSQKFPTYGEFAEADLEKIYGKENLENAVHYSATNFKSVFLLSNSGGFEIVELNEYAQMSTINSGITLDVNNDGNLDFIGVGNNFAAEVETVRYDSGRSVVLLGDGKGGFNLIQPSKSGFFSNSDDKDLILIGRQILIGSNNSIVKSFKQR
jgi:hypothetical protein